MAGLRLAICSVILLRNSRCLPASAVLLYTKKREGDLMNIIEKNLKDIKPYEKNPRKNDEAVKYVAESIKQFGFKVPIVIDKNNIIVAGHTRYKAARCLALASVPCIIADDLTDEQIKAYRLTDNKVAEKAEWDFGLLGEELDGIFDIDVGLFGFDPVDILLDVDDDDFIKDTEVTKEKKPKIITCPHCGEEIEI